VKASPRRLAGRSVSFEELVLGDSSRSSWTLAAVSSRWKSLTGEAALYHSRLGLGDLTDEPSELNKDDVSGFLYIMPEDVR
jgi:hypothetical protein